MHSISIRSFSLFMAFWLMVTSIGASIDVHFCNGEIYSIGVNTNADKCPGFSADVDSHTPDSFRKSRCCDQFSAHFQSDIESGNDDLAIQYLMASVLSPIQHEIDFLNSAEPVRLCSFYTPPDQDEDVLSAFCVLRI